MPFRLTNRLWGDRRLPGGDDALDPVPVAVVDIGSNSVRLVVYDGALRSPTPIFNEKVLCGLGREVGTTGVLGAEATARATSALKRFRAVTRHLGVGLVRAVATAAAREARDGPDFIARASDILGCEIEVLSGEREAELAARGILMGFEQPDGVAGDLGGGSLELISVRKKSLSKAVSLPLGVLRLENSAGGNISDAQKIVRRELEAVSWLRKERPKRFFAVGGSWRALAKLHMARSNYPLRVMHHYQMTPTQVRELTEAVRRSRKSGQPLDGLDAVGRTRRDTLVYGAITLERTLEIIQPEEVVLSVFGIREGLVHEMLSEHERRRDPLITFCEAYADLRARGGAQAGHEVFDWMTPAIEALGRETDADRRLRLAACLMSDIGWRAHPDYRGEQSLNVVAHSGMTGIDHMGRLFLALVVHYRHKGSGTAAEVLSNRLIEMAGPEQLARARLVASALRSAHLITCGVAGILPDTPITCDNGRMALHLPQEFATLHGERVDRRFSSFADAVGLTFAVEIEQAGSAV